MRRLVLILLAIATTALSIEYEEDSDACTCAKPCPEPAVCESCPPPPPCGIFSPTRTLKPAKTRTEPIAAVMTAKREHAPIMVRPSSKKNPVEMRKPKRVDSEEEQDENKTDRKHSHDSQLQRALERAPSRFRDENSDSISKRKFNYNREIRFQQAKSTTTTTTTEASLIEVEDDEHLDDPKCNSKTLRAIMDKQMNDNSAQSKRRVNEAAEAKFNTRIDVICSRGHFSYVYSSNLFCETTKGLVTCIAFRQSLK